MRLLFIHQFLGDRGGAETGIALTVEELARRGHSLGLLYGAGTGKNEDRWKSRFETVRQIRADARNERASATNSAHASIADAITSFNPDALYLHTISDVDVLEALVDSGVPIVRMVHDHQLYCLRSYKYNPLTRKICTRAASGYCVFPCMATLARNRGALIPFRWASYTAKRRELDLNRHFQQFLVYSEYCRQELIRNGFAAEKIRIHVPLRCWGTTGPCCSFSDRNLLVFAGQIIRGKGVDVLLRALAKVKTPFECLILGEGGHRPACERLARKLGLSSRVRFVGYVPHEQLRDFYLDASAFLVSSLWPEPFGMVGPEAMLYGLPVVAFDAGGIREWLINGENGHLVPWGDTDAFARSVDHLLNRKEEARAMGRRGLARVNDRYDSSVQVDELEQIFIEVINKDSVCTNESASLSVVDGHCR